MNRTFSLSMLVAFALVAVGCGRRDQGPAGVPQAKTFAKLLATSGAAPVAFKDIKAAQQIAASVSVSKHVQFAILARPDGEPMGQFFAPAFRDNREQLFVAIQAQLKIGEGDFAFGESGLFVSVAAMKSSEHSVGYAVVGSL